MTKISDLLSYNPETGDLVWRVSRGGHIRAGKTAGGFHTGGKYRVVHALGKPHLSHRVAWLLYTGSWPAPGFEIDHINGNGFDNRIANLRLATRAQNSANRRHAKGVRIKPSNKPCKRFEARVQQRSLGYFPTFDDARKAYVEELSKVYGEFAP